MPRRGEPSNLNERVAAEVRALMGRYGVTQMMLSKVLGVSQPQVGQRLKCAIAFDVNELDKLAAYFDVDPEELLGGSSKPRPRGPDDGLHAASGARQPTVGYVVHFPAVA